MSINHSGNGNSRTPADERFELFLDAARDLFCPTDVAVFDAAVLSIVPRQRVEAARRKDPIEGERAEAYPA